MMPFSPVKVALDYVDKPLSFKVKKRSVVLHPTGGKVKVFHRAGCAAIRPVWGLLFRD